MVEVARKRKVGYGLDTGVEMGPVISAASKTRVEGLISTGKQEGASVLVDGRGKSVPGHSDGYFVFPTILDGVSPQSTLAHTEIFGPVLSIMHAATLEEAIALVNERSYGNMACLFTTDGAAARRFRYEVTAGNVGINVGVAAPMAYFPFSGWGESFFGDLHAQAHHGVEFYTQTKVVVERWPRDWSRRF
jgi:malonate-semialdehyde dehydrogenase (acetylating)/methylmalonate-semialdehyde dehydrogenase